MQDSNPSRIRQNNEGRSRKVLKAQRHLFQVSAIKGHNLSEHEVCALQRLKDSNKRVERRRCTGIDLNTITKTPRVRAMYFPRHKIALPTTTELSEPNCGCRLTAIETFLLFSINPQTVIERGSPSRESQESKCVKNRAEAKQARKTLLAQKDSGGNSKAKTSQ